MADICSEGRGPRAEARPATGRDEPTISCRTAEAWRHLTYSSPDRRLIRHLAINSMSRRPNRLCVVCQKPVPDRGASLAADPSMTAAEQLADARRKLGLSLDDISLRTKISVERLRAVETADAALLPSFVYLKGFVRAYAAEVKLDPDVIWGRYIAELSEPDALTLHEEHLVPIPASADALAEFESEDDHAELMPPQPTLSGDSFVAALERATRAAVSEPLDAAPAAVGSTHIPLGPDVAHRKSFALVPLVLATTLAIVGAYLLSANVDRRSPREAPDSNSARAAGSDPAAAVNPAPRQPSVPDPTNIDRPPSPARPAPGTGSPRRRSAVPNQTSAAPSSSSDNSTSNAASRASVGRQRDGAIGGGAVPDPAPPSVPPSVSKDRAPSENDLVSGTWNVSSKVESTTFAAYQNLTLGFRLELEQRGNHVVGDGSKVSENGTALPARRRTAIRVEGTLEGDKLALDFTEVGARRKSAGRFVLYLAESGTLRGRFTSDAAQSSGVTVAVRESSSGRN